MSGLFSHVASKFGRSTEDLATEALCYILQSDEALLEAFVNHINAASGSALHPDMRIATQKQADSGGRPDVTGWQRDGNRRLFVESKFQAGLSSEQPDGYLSDLQNDDSSVLMFLVPERRRRPVWREIAASCKSVNYTPDIDESVYHVHFDAGQYLLISTWTEVLDALEEAIPDTTQSGIAGDLHQLRVLCDQEGGGSFRPFQDGEFEPWLAERIIDLHNLVDDLMRELEERSTSWSVSSSQIGLSNMNYRFFAHLYDCKAEIGIRYRWWAKHGHSPLWVRLYIKDFAMQAAAKDAMKWRSPVLEGGDFGRTHLLIPFDLPTGRERAGVHAHLLHQLDTIATRLRSLLTDAS